MLNRQIQILILIQCIYELMADQHQLHLGQAKHHYTSLGVHKKVMAIFWGPLINISVFLIYYRYRQYTFYIHAIVGFVITAISLWSVLPRLIIGGYKTGIKFHFIFGTIVIGLAVTVVVLGVLIWVKQTNQFSKSTVVYYIKQSHVLLAFLVLLIAKIQIYLILKHNKQLFLISQIIFWILYLVRKFTFPTLSSKVQEKTSLKGVSSLQQLDYLGKDLIIFNNKVYDIENMKENHPVGYEVIESIKGKQADRFLYGMYTSQKIPEIPVHTHSRRSIELLGDPLAELSIQSNYNLSQQSQTEVSIASISRVMPNSSIYEMRLKKIDGEPISFKKYTQISQLGRYFCLSKDNKITRLYTSVNFLQEKNIEFMVQHILIPNRINCDWAKNRLKSSSSLPLMMKHYPQGAFTKMLPDLDRNQTFNLSISSPSGLGLQLDKIRPGKIMIMVGGTGLYPFSDLIDLIFKSEIIRIQLEHYNFIISENPVLAVDPIRKYSFVLYVACDKLEDIHPLTLQQIYYLSKNSNILKTNMRVKGRIEQLDEIKRNGVGIFGENQLFENILQRELRNGEFSKIFVCGPPKMNESMYKMMSQTLQPSFYQIM